MICTRKPRALVSISLCPPQHADAVLRCAAGILNGGILSTLLDCHGNWTAAIALMDRSCLPKPPLTLTASMLVSSRHAQLRGMQREQSMPQQLHTVVRNVPDTLLPLHPAVVSAGLL